MVLPRRHCDQLSRSDIEQHLPTIIPGRSVFDRPCPYCVPPAEAVALVARVCTVVARVRTLLASEELEASPSNFVASWLSASRRSAPFTFSALASVDRAELI